MQNQKKLRIRRAGEKDAARLLLWRNDSVTRKNSFTTRKISEDEHCAWLSKALTSDRNILLMAMVSKTPIGFLRYNLLTPGTAEVNINIAPEQRGKGFGAQVLESGNAWVHKYSSIKKIKARIKTKNQASKKAFLKAGFLPARTAPDHEIYETDTKVAGKRLLLKKFGSQFLNARYISWFNDPVVCRFNRHGSGYTLKKARAYLDYLKNCGNTVVFAICLKKGGHIGNISINDIEWQKKSAEISILIGEKSRWGKGYGAEAVKTAAGFAFKQLGLKRVWVGFTENNEGMRKIAKDLGFKHFNTLKAAFRKGDQPALDVEEWEIFKK